MNPRFQSAPGLIALAALSVFVGACQQSRAPTEPLMTRLSLQDPDQASAVAAQGSPNGAAGQMPAYYDGALFTVNMKEVKTASETLIDRNSSVNEIYASNDLDDEQDFIPVIDAIQGDGFNPLWRQNLIVFKPGFTPHQFLSDEEVEAAATGANPEITIVETDEIYRCSVVGSK